MSSDLAPGFLLASPPLGDPNFDRTVVLLAAHGSEGALGFVINRVAPFSLRQFLSMAGFDAEGGDDQPVHIGGPVEPSSGWILTADPALLGDGRILEVGERLRVTSSHAAFEALSKSLPRPEGAPSALVVLGYSGWGPGQLEGEIAAGAWLPTDLDERLVFDAPIDERWERGYRGVGVAPAFGMSMRGRGEA